MSKRAKVILLSISLILISALVYIFRAPVSKVVKSSLTTVEYVSEIEYGEVYVYKQVETPSYIKFLDSKHYVAWPTVRFESDLDEGPLFNFVEGVYEEKNGNYYLGQKIRMATISFSTRDDYDNREYEGLPRIDYEVDNRFIPFTNTPILKKDGEYWYTWEVGDWKEGDKEKPSGIRTGETKLEKTNKKIPNSIEDFLSQYSQKVESSDASKNN